MSSTQKSLETGSQMKNFHGSLRRFCLNNVGAIFVLLSQACAIVMDAIARYLQHERGMHTFQVIFARMGVTLIVCSIYLWWKQIPDFPLGKPEVRPLLIFRSIFGFGGLYCIYYSIDYLSLGEAIIFRFLVPFLTDVSCSVLLHQPLSRKDFTISFLALIGIVIVAHPTCIENIFSFSIDSHDLVIGQKLSQNDTITTTQRIIAVTVATLGAVGGSSAYTTIRLIRNRAHVLISVNYFSFLGTLGSALFLLLIPGINFVMPHGFDWILLLLIGSLGFVMQSLLTTGLQLDSSPKATSMLYSQIIYATLLDWLIWGVLPDYWSIFGGSIVIGSTVWSGLSKSRTYSQETATTTPLMDEESPLLSEADNAQNNR